MKTLLKLALLCSVVLFVSCESSYDSLVNEQLEENPVPQPVTGNSGSADFSNYVAIGDALAAGLMDGALYNLGQSNSIPALMAGQLQLAGAPESFNQPDINSELGFNTVVPNPVNSTVLGRFKLDPNIPGPSPTLGGDPIGPYTGSASDLNNFGVPGIVVGQLLIPDTGNPQSAAFNPFYFRFASNPGTSTILGDAVSAQPTFLSLWIGNNDVLGYAAGGASDPTILTDPTDFDNRINAVIGTLMQNTQADGIVANIPLFLALPLFQAIPYNAIPLDQPSADQLNQALQPVNDALQALADNGIQPQDDIDRRKINYNAGQNPILAIDEELDDLEEEFDMLQNAGGIDAEQRAALVPYEQSRPLVQGELVLLSAGSLLGEEADGDTSVEDTPIGVVVPLGYDLATGNLSGDRYYLTQAEQVEIEQHRGAFNASISSAVSNFPERLGLYDTNSASSAFTDLFGLSDGVPGITIGGVSYNPDFSPNGVLSTDGVHPNPRGNGIIANDMIRVIEETFGASIPELDITLLPSVQLCAGNCLSQQ